MFTVQPTGLDAGTQTPAMPLPLLGPVPLAHDPTTPSSSSSPNTHTTLARGNNAAAALDDSDRMFTTGSLSPPAHTQTSMQLARHGQDNQGPPSVDEDEDEDMRLNRPVASSSKRTMHHDNNGDNNNDNSDARRRRRRLGDDGNDSAAP